MRTRLRREREVVAAAAVEVVREGRAARVPAAEAMAHAAATETVAHTATTAEAMAASASKASPAVAATTTAATTTAAVSSEPEPHIATAIVADKNAPLKQCTRDTSHPLAGSSAVARNPPGLRDRRLT